MNSTAVTIATDVVVPIIVSVLTYLVCDNFAQKRRKTDEIVSEICAYINTIDSLSRYYWVGGLDSVESRRIALELFSTLHKVGELLALMERFNWTFGMDPKVLHVELRKRATGLTFGQIDYSPDEKVASDVSRIANKLLVAIKTANHV